MQLVHAQTPALTLKLAGAQRCNHLFHLLAEHLHVRGGVVKPAALQIRHLRIAFKAQRARHFGAQPHHFIVNSVQLRRNAGVQAAPCRKRFPARLAVGRLHRLQKTVEIHLFAAEFRNRRGGAARIAPREVGLLHLHRHQPLVGKALAVLHVLNQNRTELALEVFHKRRRQQRRVRLPLNQHQGRQLGMEVAHLAVVKRVGRVHGIANAGDAAHRHDFHALRRMRQPFRLQLFPALRVFHLFHMSQKLFPVRRQIGTHILNLRKPLHTLPPHRNLPSLYRKPPRPATVFRKKRRLRSFNSNRLFQFCDYQSPYTVKLGV